MDGRYAAPLVLGATGTITRGQLIRLPAVDLAPKVLQPYEVSAIRMLAFPSVENAVANMPQGTSLRGFLKWQFTLGKIPLTDHFIPMWNLSPVRQTITEQGGYFEWQFKKPLLIAPGGRIDAQIQLQATTPNVGTTPTVTVSVAYVGMLRGDLDRMPPFIDVPFCSAWDTTAAGAGLANDWTTLRNPLDRPIDVERLIARIQNDTTGLDGDDSTTLQVFDPRGRALHPLGPIQFHAMFPNDTQDFPYIGQLPANTHFAVRLTNAPSTTYRPMISYLGSRRERAQ